MDHSSQIDVAAAYRSFAQPLQQIVRSEVGAPEAVIEDACHVAWFRLLTHAAAVREDRALAWLATTARREAVRLNRREARELPLEAAPDDQPLGPLPELVTEQRQQLTLTCALPERQRRILWLRVLGFSASEIARQVGCTPRTVERQLLRARQHLRRAWACQ